MEPGTKRVKRILSLLLSGVLVTGLFFSPAAGIEADAAGRTLTLKAARALALEESTAYFQVENEIETKKANLESARKKIKLKQKSMSQFRWSPLLNFKFPTSPNEATAYEWQFKPISIQAEIDKANHKLIDTKLSVYEEINNLYVEIVYLQRKISFDETQVEAYSDGLKRNQARLLTGEATQADVDAISKKLEAARTNLSTDKRTLNANLEKLSGKINMDVKTGYNFEVPFLEASIPRKELNNLINATLAQDQTYYEACLDDTTARISLQINYSLMAGKFGRDINIISGYVNQALRGVEIKGSLQKAFKASYSYFLEKIDSYWNGKKRILFIKIPKLWFKGGTDGQRFIDDDPNVLYEDCLAYSEAHVNKQKTREDLIQNVKDTFENYISIRSAYLKSIKDIEKAEADLKADLLRNKIGEISFEEYSSAADDYEELQNSFLEMMKTYSATLYSFDRLTCGAVSKYLDGADGSVKSAKAGTSHVEEETADGAYYFIKQIIQDEAFELTVYIPEDFEAEITHFELWCDNQKIGERTEIDKSLRHLAVSKNVINSAKIRLYNDGEFVDDVVIDPSDAEGPLPVVVDRKIVKTEESEIGLYETETNDVTGIATITVRITEDEAAAYYKVQTEDGISVSGPNPVKVGEGFKHLALIEESLDSLVIVVMDNSQEELYKASFVTSTRKIKKAE